MNICAALRGPVDSQHPTCEHQGTEMFRTSLVIQWLRLWAPNAGGLGSIPGQGTKIPWAIWHSQKKKERDLNSWLDQPQHCWHLGPDHPLLWGHPVPCRMFVSILVLHSLDAGSTPSPHPSRDRRKRLGMLLSISWEQTHSSLPRHWEVMAYSDQQNTHCKIYTQKVKKPKNKKNLKHNIRTCLRSSG